MDIQRLLTSLSLKIMIQLGCVVALLAIAIAWNFDFIFRFYFENQQTQTGILINSAIAIIFHQVACVRYGETTNRLGKNSSSTPTGKAGT